MNCRRILGLGPVVCHGLVRAMRPGSMWSCALLRGRDSTSKNSKLRQGVRRDQHASKAAAPQAYLVVYGEHRL